METDVFRIALMGNLRITRTMSVQLVMLDVQLATGMPLPNATHAQTVLQFITKLMELTSVPFPALMANLYLKLLLLPVKFVQVSV